MSIVGLLGVGTMGKGMLKNLVKNGHKVYTYDPASGAKDCAVKLSAIPLDNPKEVGEKVEILLASLPSSESVQAAISGEDGALHGMKEGTFICDMSTTAINVEKELYEKAREKGIGFLDCPVSGGPKGAENGALSIMIGGDEKAFKKVKFVLESIGKSIFYLGNIGSGQTVKLCNNIVQGVQLVALAESFTAAVKSGVNSKQLLDVLMSGGAYSKVLDAFGENLAKGNYDKVSFALHHMHKDMSLFMKLADDIKVPSIVSSVSYQEFNSAMNNGLGGKDVSAVATVTENMAGVKIRY